MHWKQPIPTSITSLDTVTEITLNYILLRIRNKDMEAPKEFWHGNKRHLIKLLKNQCIFSVDRFCRETAIPKNRIKSSLELLKNIQIDENLTINLTINRQSFGLIITLQNADSVFGFDNQSDNQPTINQQSNANQMQISSQASNKNDIERLERFENVEEVLPAKNEKTFWSKEQVLNNGLFLQARHRQFPLLDDSEVDFCLDLAIQTEKAKGKSFLFNNALNWLEKANENKSKQTKQSKDPNLLTF
jgi:hypothetical protein